MSGGRILVVRGGAIGDFILTLPVFSALREQFPTARLELLGYPHIAALAQAGGLVDAVRSIEARPLAGFFAKNGTLDPDLQKYFASFAIIVSYLYDPDGVFQANVARCSKAQFIAGPHRPDECAPLHAAELFLKPLERLAIFAPDSTPRLQITPNQPPQVHRSDSQCLAMHPGSGSERKNWPEEKWAETLTELLRDSNRNCLLIGGEAEGQRLSRLASALPSDRIEVYFNRPLVELAQRLAACTLFVGHDSGISHLAAALGLSAVLLWGESNEAVWRPKGPGVVVINHEPGLQALPVAKVIETVKSVLV